MIRDIFMSTGQWSFTLRHDTPREVRQGIGRHDTVCFLPGRIAGSRAGALQGTYGDYLDRALFTGRVDRHTRSRGISGRDTFSGPSLVAWLGGSSGIGPWYDVLGGGYSGTTTLGIRLVAFFADPETTNGITWDNVTTGLSTNSFTDNQPAEGRETVRTAIDRWCQLTTKRTEWRISPAGVMSFSPNDAFAIYPGDSAVLIGTDLPHELRSDLTVAPIESMTIEEDYGEWANRVDGTDGTNYQNYAASGLFAWDGSTAGHLNVLLPTFPSDPDGTALFNACQSAFNNNFTTRSRYNLTIDPSFVLAAFLAPGTRFLLWDPDTDQTGNPGVIVAGGKQLAPALVRCTGLTYPITEHVGVVGFSTAGGFSGDFTDFSPWIDYTAEPKTTTIDVGAPLVSLGRAMRRGIGL